MSYTKRVFSPIYLPFIKPVWSLGIILPSTNFILFAIVPDAILYTVSKRVRGLQFLKIFFGLLSFGIHVIMPCFLVVESCPVLCLYS